MVTSTGSEQRKQSWVVVLLGQDWANEKMRKILHRIAVGLGAANLVGRTRKCAKPQSVELGWSFRRKLELVVCLAFSF